MKKTIVCLLTLVLAFGSLCVFAADKPEFLKFNADPSESSVEICDEVCGNGGEYITVSIASQSKCETSFSKDNTPDIFDVYLLDEEGKIGKNINFSDKLGVGRYNIFINEKLMFYTIYRDSDAPETLRLIDELNNAADSSAIKEKVFEGSNREILGIDREDTVLNSYLDKYCDISADVRKANVGGKFTSESFYDGLFDYIVCDMLASGSLEQALMQYGDTLGTSFDEYNQLHSDVKSGLTEMLKNVKFLSYDNENSVLVNLPQEYATALEKAQSDYDDSVLLASLKDSSDWSGLQSIMLTEANQIRIGIDESDVNVYNAIKESIRYKVFTHVYDIRADFTSLEDVLEAFRSACAIIKKESDLISNGNSSSSFGGGSLASISAPGGYEPETGISTPAVGEKILFSDIGGHYSEEYVNRMAQIGVINGYADGTFLPEGNVTRAEFAKMIMKLFNIDATRESSAFDDVADGDWHCEYVNSLSAAGIITGYDGNFNPNANITRQDAAVICYRMLSYLKINVNGSSEFDDSAAVSEYANEAVASLAYVGIIKGSDNKFMPHSNIKRSDSAIMLSRLFDLYSAN